MGSVVEDVSEVATAPAAQHLGAAHPVGAVLVELDGVGDRGLGVLAGEGPFGVGAALHVVLLGRQLLPPLGVGSFDRSFAHNASGL